MSLSIIIPCYNEENTIEIILKKILSLNLDKEIIVVDDHSKDLSLKIIEKYSQKIKIIKHQKNFGKGAAIKSALKFCRNKYTIIQDADLEYDPNDILSIYDYAVKNDSKVVFGSRVLNKKLRKNSYFFGKIANFIFTNLNNIFTSNKLTDLHTCYKLIDTNLFKTIKLTRDGFSFCVEIAVKIQKKGIIIKEVPISYTGRSYKDGKKIKLSDAFDALYSIFYFNFKN